MIAALVLGTYALGAAASYYFCATYDLCYRTQQCKLCGARMIVRNFKATCPACKAKWTWKEDGYYPISINSFDDVHESGAFIAFTWPVAMPLLGLIRKSQRVRNERIRRRLELEASEREIEKLLGDGK